VKRYARGNYNASIFVNAELNFKPLKILRIIIDKVRLKQNNAREYIKLNTL